MELLGRRKLRREFVQSGGQVVGAEIAGENDEPVTVEGRARFLGEDGGPSIPAPHHWLACVNRHSWGWLVTMLVALGESDCEVLRSGLLVQPVNAITSLAFVVVGLAVASRGRKEQPCTAIVFAALLVAVGLGSVAFHGPQLPGAQLLHDTPIHLLLAFVVLYRVGGGQAAVSLGALATVGAASVLVVATAPGFTAALTGVLAAMAVLVEARWHALGSRPWRERRLTAALVAVVAAAGICFVLGRTGAPTCDPLGILQFHGLWHVSAATALGLWWWQGQSSQGSSEPPADSAERAPGAAAQHQGA